MSLSFSTLRRSDSMLASRLCRFILLISLTFSAGYASAQETLPVGSTSEALGQSITLDKRAGAILINGDGTYTIPFAFTIGNDGDLVLDDILLIDTLKFGTYAPGNVTQPGTYELASLPFIEVDNGSGFVTDPTYDGTSQFHMLSVIGDASLAPGDSIVVGLAVRFFPLPGVTTITNDACSAGDGFDDDDLSYIGGVKAFDLIEIEIPPTLPSIAVSKDAGPVISNSDNTFSIPYSITVKNDGSANLAPVQLLDSLAFEHGIYLPDSATNPGSYTFETKPALLTGTSSGFAINPDYDGETFINLLSSTGSLGANDSIVVSFAVRMHPVQGDSVVINKAVANSSGVSSRDSTTVVLPERVPAGTDSIVVSKRAGDAVAHPDNTFSIPYWISVTNAGDSTLTTVQLADSLAPEHGAYTPDSVNTVGTYTLSIAPELVHGSGSGFAVNSDFDGDSDTRLLSNSGNLAANDSLVVNFTVRLFPQPGDSVITNSAFATGGSGGGGGGGSSGGDTITVHLHPYVPPIPASIAVKKEAGEVVYHRDKSVTIPFSISVTNTGTSVLHDILLVDSLELGSLAIGDLTVGTYEISQQPSLTYNAPDPLTINSGYNGASDIHLLSVADGGSLAPNDSFAISFDVTLLPEPDQTTISNQATASGDGFDDGDPIIEDGVTSQSDLVIVVVQPPPPLLNITKVADRRTVEPGEHVVYRVRLQNGPGIDSLSVTVFDEAAEELIAVAGTSLLTRYGDDRILGTGDDRSSTLAFDSATNRFSPFKLAPEEVAEISYIMRVASTAEPGTYGNIVTVLSGGVEATASANVELVEDPIFQRSTVVGKVFEDKNGNGLQDPFEFGIPGVHVATADGLIVETDQHGRYHIADVDGGNYKRGRNLVMKIVKTTLPQGASFSTDNPRVVRITQGMLHQADFGVVIPPLETHSTETPLWESFEIIRVAEHFVDSTEVLLDDAMDSLHNSIDYVRRSEIVQALYSASNANIEPAQIPVPFQITIYGNQGSAIIDSTYYVVVDFATWTDSLISFPHQQVSEIIDRWHRSGTIDSVSVTPQTAIIIHIPTALTFVSEDVLAYQRAVEVVRILESEYQLLARADTRTSTSQAQQQTRTADRDLEYARVDTLRSVLENALPQSKFVDTQHADPADCDSDSTGILSQSVFALIACDPATASRVQIIDDPLQIEPMLNIGTTRFAQLPVDSIDFYLYTNYSSFVDRFELRIYDGPDLDYAVLVDTVAQEAKTLDEYLTWDIPAGLSTVHGERYFYVLRAYDRRDRYDETEVQVLQFSDQSPDANESASEQYRRDVYGRSRLVRQQIPVGGNRIRLTADLPDEQTQTDQSYLTLSGIHIPVIQHEDTRSFFVMETIVPGRRSGALSQRPPRSTDTGEQVPFDETLTGISYFDMRVDPSSLDERTVLLVDSLRLAMQKVLPYEPTIRIEATSYINSASNVATQRDSRTDTVFVEFDSGRATLDDTTGVILNNIASAWAVVDSITVTGYADRDPIRPGTVINGENISNNFELGDLRARVVLDTLAQYFDRNGLSIASAKKDTISHGDEVEFRNCRPEEVARGLVGLAECKRRNRRVDVRVDGLLEERQRIARSDSAHAHEALAHFVGQFTSFDVATTAVTTIALSQNVMPNDSVRRIDYSIRVTYTETRPPPVEPAPDPPTITSDSDCDRYLFGIVSADLSTGSDTETNIDAFARGKVNCTCAVTGRLSLDDDDGFDNLFRLRNSGSPNEIFRNLDQDRYYPTYGDGSTTLETTPTLSPVYARIDCNQYNAVLGNFNTGFTGTEFAQYNRSLFGGKGVFNSRSTTRFGDSRYQLASFASNPETAFGHETHRATGGSVYYLRETNIVFGSAKARIEVRDRDSDRVIENVALRPGRDYEIDELQGRIILTRPLNQVVDQANPSLIKDEPLDGNRVFILIDYEFLPTGFEADNLTAGFRTRAWATDNVGAGLTAVTEQRDLENYQLLGADVILKGGNSTYVKAEFVETESNQTYNSTISDDGGLTFTPPTASIGTSGMAMGLESRLDLRDFSEVDGQISGWWRKLDAGYSPSRLGADRDVTSFGAEAMWNSTDHFQLAARASSLDKDGLGRQDRYSAQVDYDPGIYNVAAEIQYQSNELDDLLLGKSSAVTATTEDAYLAAVKVGRDFGSRQNIYTLLQTSFAESNTYAKNDRAAVGIRSRISDKLSLRSEVGTGSRGFGMVGQADIYFTRFSITSAASVGALPGARVGGAWRVSNERLVYGNYTMSTDRNDDQRGAVTLGQRMELSNQVNLFSEGQFVRGTQHVSLAHAYGIDYAPIQEVNVGASLQLSDLDNAASGQNDRDAVSVWASLESARVSAQSRVEFRRDGGLVTRRQFVLAERGEFRINPSSTLLGKLNHAVTTDDLDRINPGRFTEGALGFSYRPVRHNNMNLLSKLIYLYDLPSIGQSLLRPAQRATVVSAETTYRISKDHTWSAGSKFATRRGAMRLSRTGNDWLDSDKSLAIMQIRFRPRIPKINSTIVDAVAEYRILWSAEDEQKRHGILVGAFRELHKYMTLGAGYNFSGFSDDLTNVDINEHGWFVSFTGKL